MNRNNEKYDPRVEEVADWNQILSKHFLHPHETPEAQLAALIDSGNPFDYKDSLFYKIRSGQAGPWIKKLPVSTNWWDMPWLRVSAEKKTGRKKHGAMLKLLKGFTVLFLSMKQNGLLVPNFQSRIRSDKLINGQKTCYIYVDANKRMGILGYLRESGQIKIEKIPVKIARSSNSHKCSWMPAGKSKSLFNFPFEVLSL